MCITQDVAAQNHSINCDWKLCAGKDIIQEYVNDDSDDLCRRAVEALPCLKSLSDSCKGIRNTETEKLHDMIGIWERYTTKCSNNIAGAAGTCDMHTCVSLYQPFMYSASKVPCRLLRDIESCLAEKMPQCDYEDAKVWSHSIERIKSRGCAEDSNVAGHHLKRCDWKMCASEEVVQQYAEDNDDGLCRRAVEVSTCLKRMSRSCSGVQSKEAQELNDMVGIWDRYATKCSNYVAGAAGTCDMHTCVALYQPFMYSTSEIPCSTFREIESCVSAKMPECSYEDRQVWSHSVEKIKERGCHEDIGGGASDNCDMSNCVAMYQPYMDTPTQIPCSLSREIQSCLSEMMAYCSDGEKQVWMHTINQFMKRGCHEDYMEPVVPVITTVSPPYITAPVKPNYVSDPCDMTKCLGLSFVQSYNNHDEIGMCSELAETNRCLSVAYDDCPIPFRKIILASIYNALQRKSKSCERKGVGKPNVQSYGENCNKRPVLGNPRRYERNVYGFWIDRMCPRGTRFSAPQCSCITARNNNAELSRCDKRAVKRYPEAFEEKDVSGAWIHKWCDMGRVFQAEECACRPIEMSYRKAKRSAVKDNEKDSKNGA